MISTVGIGVLSLSIIGFGFSYNRGLKNEKECVEGLIQLTERINTRIKCFRQGVSEIFDGFSNPFLDATGFTANLDTGRPILHYARLPPVRKRYVGY